MITVPNSNAGHLIFLDGADNVPDPTLPTPMLILLDSTFIDNLGPLGSTAPVVLESVDGIGFTGNGGCGNTGTCAGGEECNAVCFGNSLNSLDSCVTFRAVVGECEASDMPSLSPSLAPSQRHRHDLTSAPKRRPTFLDPRVDRSTRLD